MQVPWEKLGHEKYESAVATLLQRLYPNARRIDGKGGDGGRDVQTNDRETGAIIDAFQLKSFTGRVKGSRRSQVRHSLEKAAHLNPKRWILVVPIDPNPSELEWFQTLGKKYPFQIEWFGKTWLDDKMAAKPDIQRYCLEGINDNIVRILQTFGAEQAEITSVPDAMKRHIALQERLDQISPHYHYQITAGPNVADNPPQNAVMSYISGDIRVDVYTKHAGALAAEPITITMGVEPENEALQSALDYGLGVHLPPESIISASINAPNGLGMSITDAQFQLIPIGTELDKPITVALEIMKGEELIASYPIKLTDRTMGDKGSIHAGADSTGWLNIEIKFNRDAQVLEIEFQLTPTPVMTTSLLPLCRWLRAWQSSDSLVFRFPDCTDATSELPTAFPNQDALCQIIEDFQEIQEHSGKYVEMPIPLTPEDQRYIVGTTNLLRTKCVDFTWKAHDFHVTNATDAGIEELRKDQLHSLVLERDLSLKIRETVFPIGRVRDYFESVRITMPKDAEQNMQPGSPLHLRLSPEHNNKGRRTLLD